MAIGQKLEDARNRKGISIREASESTKIRGDFLTSFEKGNFDINLPEVYLRGFIRVYARFLGIDPESAVADLSMEIGSGKNKSTKKTIGKIGSSESSEINNDLTSAETTKRLSGNNSGATDSRKTIIFIGVASSAVLLIAILLVVVFSTSNNDEVENSAFDSLPDQTIVRETKLDAVNKLEGKTDATKALDENTVVESILKLAAIGPIDRLIISNEGKSPKVFHEFKNVERGWEQSIPFTRGFRCYSSSLQNIRFAVNDGIEKQVKGEGAGNFSWFDKEL